MPRDGAVSVEAELGGRCCRARARRFVEAAKADAPLLKMEQELKDRDSRIMTLEQTVKEFQQRIEAMESKRKTP